MTGHNLSGERVLDVAAGNGNATLAAACRFASVTSTDYVPALLERGRRRAEAEGFDVTFEVADAALPYPAATFDVVLSTFGVMFAPEHEQAASELMRSIRALSSSMIFAHAVETASSGVTPTSNGMPNVVQTLWLRERIS